MPGTHARALSPFSDLDLAGFGFRGEDSVKGRHGQIESIGVLAKRLEGAVVEREARLPLPLSGSRGNHPDLDDKTYRMQRYLGSPWTSAFTLSPKTGS